MSTPSKYKIGDKINSFEIIDMFKGDRIPYVCVCICGNLINKTSTNLRKNFGCIKCKGKTNPITKRPVFEIGDFINGFKITAIEKNSKRNIYHFYCECGQIQKKSSEFIKKFKYCRKCSTSKRTEIHIGKKYNNFLILSRKSINGSLKYENECQTCKRKSFDLLGNIKVRKWCENCIRGLYPGKIIDENTLINREGNGYWSIKCKCGTVFKSLLSKYNGRIASCGCRKREELLEKAKLKIGLKYNHLKIKKILGFEDASLWFELKCVCGNTIKRPNGNEFKSESCGCKWHNNCRKGENHQNSILKNIEVNSIRELFKSGLYDYEELSEMFNISLKYTKMLIKNLRRK